MYHLLIALLIAAASPAKPVPVKAEAAAKHKFTASQTFTSSKKGLALVVTDEIEGGDFPQAVVYVRSGATLYRLGAYRSVRNVKWAADGTTVVFDGAQLRDYGVDDLVKVTYKVGARTMSRQVTGEAKDEASG